MKVTLQQHISSTFPLFALDVSGSSFIIGGGGGSSNSGVPNKIQKYKDGSLCSECDFQKELVHAVHYFGQEGVAVVTSHFVKLVDETGELKVIDSVEIGGELQATCFTKSFAVVCVCGKLRYYAVAQGKLQLRFERQIENCTKISKIFALNPREGNDVVALTEKEVLEVRAPEDLSQDLKDTIQKRVLDVQYPNRVVWLAEERILFLAIQPRCGTTKAQIYNKAFERVEEEELKGVVATAFCAEQQLYLLFSDGRLAVYNIDMKRIFQYKTQLTELQTNVCADGQHVVAMSVDGFQEMQLIAKNKGSLLAMVLTVFLISFLYLLIA